MIGVELVGAAWNLSESKSPGRKCPEQRWEELNSDKLNNLSRGTWGPHLYFQIPYTRKLYCIGDFFYDSIYQHKYLGEAFIRCESSSVRFLTLIT